MNEAKNAFLQQYGKIYGYGGTIEEWRKTDFERLKDSIYLDHAGSTLYSNEQIELIMTTLKTNVFGNPHSQNPSSLLTTKLTGEIRQRILKFFGTDSTKYSVIFTSGATAALKLIGEVFPWTQQSKFVYTADNHNSVLGIREYAYQHGASVSHCSGNDVAFIDGTEAPVPHLFALPAESNFSGSQMNLELVHQIHAKGKHWRVLLDAAAFVGHSRLDLGKLPFDFVIMSFYKMFGYPTGLGALIVRNDAAQILRKRYFGGGTVEGSLYDDKFRQFRGDVSMKFEDGTVSFLDILALSPGFDILERLGIDNISKHTRALTQYLYHELNTLRHDNGSLVCEIYGNHRDYPDRQGPIVTMSLFRPNGEYVGYNEVQQLASLNQIHIRTGCFCNPGGCQIHLRLTKEEVLKNLQEGHVCWDDKDVINGKPTGAIRVSFGYMSTFEDAYAFVTFLKKYFVRAQPTLSALPGQSRGTLSSIFVYPIKSCGSFAVQNWEIGANGLLYDREWVLVDHNGSYINQKKVPQMCLIQPRIDLQNSLLKLDAPGMDTLNVLLSAFPSESKELKVCGDKCSGYAYGDEVNRWFASFLKIDCTLVRYPKTSARTAHSKIGESDSSISFTNESQFLIVNEASVQDVNEKIRSAGNDLHLEPLSFRPNLVIGGIDAFAEDHWDVLSVSGQNFEIIGACNRCQMICIDQYTGQVNKLPFLTLAQYRRFQGKVLFGVHGIHNKSSSQFPYQIQCGSVVEFISWNGKNQ